MIVVRKVAFKISVWEVVLNVQALNNIVIQILSVARGYVRKRVIDAQEQARIVHLWPKNARAIASAVQDYARKNLKYVLEHRQTMGNLMNFAQTIHNAKVNIV